MCWLSTSEISKIFTPNATFLSFNLQLLAIKVNFFLMKMLKKNSRSNMNVHHPDWILQGFALQSFLMVEMHMRLMVEMHMRFVGLSCFFLNQYMFSACYIDGDIAISHFLFYFSEEIINQSLAFHSLHVFFTIYVGFDIYRHILLYGSVLTSYPLHFTVLSRKNELLAHLTFRHFPKVNP